MKTLDDITVIGALNAAISEIEDIEFDLYQISNALESIPEGSDLRREAVQLISERDIANITTPYCTLREKIKSLRTKLEIGINENNKT